MPAAGHAPWASRNPREGGRRSSPCNPRDPLASRQQGFRPQQKGVASWAPAAGPGHKGWCDAARAWRSWGRGPRDAAPSPDGRAWCSRSGQVPSRARDHCQAHGRSAGRGRAGEPRKAQQTVPCTGRAFSTAEQSRVAALLPGPQQPSSFLDKRLLRVRGEERKSAILGVTGPHQDQETPDYASEVTAHLKPQVPKASHPLPPRPPRSPSSPAGPHPGQTAPGAACTLAGGRRAGHGSVSLERLSECLSAPGTRASSARRSAQDLSTQEPPALLLSVPRA